MFPHNGKIPVLYRHAMLKEFPAMALGKTLRPDQIYIFGPNGVGKSHLAAALANAGIWPGFPMWIDPKALLAALNSAQRFEYEVSQDWIISEISNNAGVVILDDMLSAIKNDKGLAALMHVIDVRIVKKAPIIVTTDRMPSEVQGLDSSIASRLLSMYPVKLSGPDRRMRGKMLAIDMEQGIADEIDL